MKLKLIKIMRNMNFFKIMCCALCMMLFVPQTSKAEKVQYGKYITYDGKVDANKKPNGKGKLELAYKAQGVVGLETNKDVLEGVFADGKVSNAKLAIAKYNGPLWINSAKFKGTLEFTIADDGSSITYNLLEGELETKDYPAFIISSDTPLTITRIPHPDGCETKAGKLFKANYNSSLSVNNIPNGYFYPLNLSELGNIKNIKKHTTYELNADFSTRESGTEYSVELENGGVLSKSNDGISFTLPNKDFFYITSSNVQGYKFKKTLQEGVLSFTGEKVLSFTGENFFLLKGNDGERKGYWRNKLRTANDVINLMKASSLQSVGGTVYEGHIAELIEKTSLGNAQGLYDLAVALLDGNGVEKDENLGRLLLNKAKENGNESAIARVKAEAQKINLVGTWKLRGRYNNIWEDCTWTFNADGTKSDKATTKMTYPIGGINCTFDLIQKRTSDKWTFNDGIITFLAIPLNLTLDVNYLKYGNYTAAQKQKINASLPAFKRQAVNEAIQDWRSQVGKKCAYTIVSYTPELLVLKGPEGEELIFDRIQK